MMPGPFLRGEKIDLRGLTEEDALGPYPSWFNDDEVCQNNGHHLTPYSVESALAYIRESQKSDHRLVLAIVGKASVPGGFPHIGNVALDQIHHIHRSAELTIIIGEKSEWGKGYGTEAARLICHHGFHALNLHRIFAGTYETNLGFRRLAKALGMFEEGIRKQAAYKNGRYVDIVEYGLLKEEFYRKWPMQ